MSTSPDCTVIELRRYSLVEGSAERFSRSFETWFPEAFQQLGALVLGHFFERGPVERFTWLRGYPDMAARAAVNTAFYDGPVWREHRAALNQWILDSDNVLLLRPLHPGSGIPGIRAVDPVAEPDGAGGIAVLQIFPVKEGALDECALAADPWFASYQGSGVVEVGILATLDAANNFPRHPIRSDGTFLVWMGVLRDQGALEGLHGAFAAGAAAIAQSGLLAGPAELLVLDPGQRSRLRWIRSAG
ncbi:MAG: NIPSNAP family protein [Pseudomonadota bacterium]